MIHTALRWNDHNKKDLWPLALSYAVHLHNEISLMETCLTPNELWSRSKSSYIAVVQAHLWECPVYVLQLRLQDGEKVPKWQPRSRRGQYMGASLLHANTVGIIRNLRTNKVSPQFHVVYDYLFKTVHSGDIPPDVCPEIIIFNQFKSDYYDSDFFPDLNDEWITPVERTQSHQADQDHRNHDDTPSPQDGTAHQRALPPESTDPQDGQSHPPEQRTPAQRAPKVLEKLEKRATSTPESPTATPETFEYAVEELGATNDPSPVNPVHRNPRRNFRQPERFCQHGFSLVKSYCCAMTAALILTQGHTYDNSYLLNLLLDHNFGQYENLYADSLMLHPHAMKASATVDPDSQRLDEEMYGKQREDLLKATGKETSELESHGTWNIVRNTSMPQGTKLLSSTRAFIA